LASVRFIIYFSPLFPLHAASNPGLRRILVAIFVNNAHITLEILKKKNCINPSKATTPAAAETAAKTDTSAKAGTPAKAGTLVNSRDISKQQGLQQKQGH